MTSVTEGLSPEGTVPVLSEWRDGTVPLPGQSLRSDS